MRQPYDVVGYAMTRLPPLSAVRVFEAAARHESFTRAAAELGMTQSAVSYQIKLLEERLGAPLFVRRAGRVTLSDAGRVVGPRIAEAFALMESAFGDVSATAAAVLTITVQNTFATRWLVPRLERFRRAHPAIGVTLDADSWLVDLVGTGYDAGIRSGLGDWPGLAADELMPVLFTPMASPALLARVGPLDRPSDVLRAPLISARDNWWPIWFEAAGAPGFEPDRAPVGVDVRMQQLEGGFALAGEGVALMTPSMWADELADGRLIQLFDTVATDGHMFWLVAPEARRRSPKVRAFREWLLAEIVAGG